ncbi:MAG: hypothetical protein WBF17_23830 [Phycisphaerae bacterium]
MAETIESFVAKLQEEGVEAGRKEADRLRAEAEEQAAEIIRKAQAQAEKVLADAERRAKETLARSQTELALASRDAALRLQDALGRALSGILAHDVGDLLSDSDYLGRLLHDIVMAYVQSDFEQRDVLSVNVAPEMREKLISWALKEIGEETVERVRPSIDLRGSLAGAGFEYTVTGSTIEVTRDSVVETLMDLVGPGLREVLAKASAEGKEEAKE